METRAQLGVMPRLAIILLTVALLVIGAVGGYAIGSSIVDASDGGEPTAGLTYYSPDGAIYTTDEAGEPVRLTGDDEMAGTNAWSPEGTRFAYESWAGVEGPTTIMIRDADGSNPIAVSEPFEAPQGNVARPYLAWSPDGTTVLYWASGTDVVDERGCSNPGTFCGMRIWSAASDGSRPAQVIGDPALDARSPLYTPDGEHIIFTGSEGNGGGYGVYRMDADGANVERIGDLTGSAYAFDRHAISPDGTTLAVVSGHGMYDIYLVDLVTGEETLIAGEGPDEIEPYWSPDGSMIAFTSMERSSGAVEMMLYDVASGAVTSLGTSISAHGWSPDGRFIVSGSDGLGTTVTLVDVTDPAAPVVTEHEDLVDAFMPSWRPVS